ncbi:MAG: hypothetical protein IJ109_00840 [Firmicutes bacterium]|nr:hypothetical protein [Bacillota bacterium]
MIARIIHDQQQEEQDLDTEMKLAENDEDNTDQDENLPQKETTEATKTQNQQQVAKTSGEEKNSGQAPKTVHDNNSSNRNKADKSGSNKGKDDKNSKNKKGTKGSGNAGGGGESGGQGGKRQVYDDDGNVVDLPEDVNSVVAAGNAGVITQMLGGKDILKGSSASVTASPLAQSVFADEGLAAARSYWDGEGASPMDSASFKELLASKPDVCVGNGASFSDNQIASLKKAGIAYVSIPALDTPEHIEKAVSIIGKMLGDRSSGGGVNAKKLASDYAEYCADLTASVGRAAGNSADRCFSLYVVGWDPSATFSIPGVLQESGVAYTSAGGRPVSDYMRIGGVTDNTMSYQMSAATDYAIIPLNINVESNPSVSNGLSLLRKTDNNSFVRNSSYNLGDGSFQWIIADSEYTRECIEYSAATGGIWTPFPRVTASSGGTSVTDYGFLAGNRIVRTNLRGDYQVAVNPSGVGSWADGSCESVLECIWTAWRIAGVCSESDVRNEIRTFYSTFYRHDLSDGEIDAILAGRD